MKYEQKFVLNNQIKYNYTVMRLSSDAVLIRCNKCGALKFILLKSMRKQILKSWQNGEDEPFLMHNQFCSNYYLDICKYEVGYNEAMAFHDFYRRSHERCYNSNCKDYERYKGKFGFEDFTDFFKSCFYIYKLALQIYNYDELSIDRIHSDKGYEAGNIRFVPMYINLQNKPNVKPVEMINIKTGERFCGNSFGELARNFNPDNWKNISSSLYAAAINNRFYLGVWKVKFVTSSSTIESHKSIRAE